MTTNNLAPTYADNNATIQQIQTDKLIPRIKYVDIMMSWLHGECALETYVAVYYHTRQNKADLNTKSLGGETLQTKHVWSVGYQYYQPIRSEHHRNHTNSI